MVLLDGLIGEGVGELYVAKYFPPGHKAAMDTLVANLRTAMGERLKTLAWMDEATRAEAQKKLATFDPRIGYPSKWRDYSAFAVEEGSRSRTCATGGSSSGGAGRAARAAGRSQRMGHDPQTINAGYNPLMNQITFPAAILQAPFFDPNADPAVNYGAIGAVIGHESATASTIRAANSTRPARSGTGGATRPTRSSWPRPRSSGRSTTPFARCPARASTAS